MKNTAKNTAVSVYTGVRNGVSCNPNIAGRIPEEEDWLSVLSNPYHPSGRSLAPELRLRIAPSNGVIRDGTSVISLEPCLRVFAEKTHSHRISKPAEPTPNSCRLSASLSRIIFKKGP